MPTSSVWCALGGRPNKKEFENINKRNRKQNKTKEITWQPYSPLNLLILLIFLCAWTIEIRYIDRGAYSKRYIWWILVHMSDLFSTAIGHDSPGILYLSTPHTSSIYRHLYTSSDYTTKPHYSTLFYPPLPTAPVHLLPKPTSPWLVLSPSADLPLRPHYCPLRRQLSCSSSATSFSANLPM